MPNEQPPQDLGPEALDQTQQQQIRDQMINDRMARRRNRTRDLPANQLPNKPAANPTGRTLPTTSPTASNNASGPQTGASSSSAASSSRPATPVTRADRFKQFSRNQVRKQLHGAAVNVVGRENMSRLFALLLVIAVFKDTADLLSLSLFSWIDWSIDLILWLLFVVVFQKTPKKIRFEIQLVASAATIVELVPILDLLTTWTFMAVYTWWRTSSTAVKAFQSTAKAFQQNQKTAIQKSNSDQKAA